MSGRVSAWTLGLALLGAAAGCSRTEPEPATRCAVLFTLDTFRSDHLGCAGNPIVRTPHLDRLARRGVQWSNAFSPIPLTTPSHATIFSGVSPRVHGVLKNRTRLPDAVTTFPERIRATGVRTGAVISAPIVLGPDLGLNRGFDAYAMTTIGGRPVRAIGTQTAALAAQWLSQAPGSSSFLWAHFFDAHLPYEPPRPFDRLYDRDYEGAFDETKSRVEIQAAFENADVSPRDVDHLRALYASAVTFLDLCVGSLVREVLLGPDGERTLFCVVGDHGEGLHEHDRYFGHDTLLYDTALRVPLFLSGGSLRPALRPETARTIDVAPTLLGWFGIDADVRLEGRDLLREPAQPGPIFVETHPAEKKAAPAYGVRGESRKVLWHPDASVWESYDLENDPSELHDLGERHDGPFAELTRSLANDLSAHPPTSAGTIDEENGGPTDEVIEALRSLGYLDAK